MGDLPYQGVQNVTKGQQVERGEGKFFFFYYPTRFHYLMILQSTCIIFSFSL